MPRGKPKSKYPELYGDSAPDQRPEYRVVGPGAFRVAAQTYVFGFNEPNYNWNTQVLGAVQRATCTWAGFYNPGIAGNTDPKGDYILFQAIPLPNQSVNTAADIISDQFIGGPAVQSSYVYLIKYLQFQLLFPGYWRGEADSTPTGMDFFGDSWVRFHCMSTGECNLYSQTLRFTPGTSTVRNIPYIRVAKFADLHAPRVASTFLVKPIGALGGRITQKKATSPGYDSTWTDYSATSGGITTNLHSFNRWRNPDPEFNYLEPLNLYPVTGLGSGQSSFIPLISADESRPNFVIQKDRWLFCSFAPPVMAANTKVPAGNTNTPMWYTMRLDVLYATSIEDLIPYFNVR